MKIKDKLSLYFTTVSGTLLLSILAGVYFLSVGHRESDFHERLLDRATTSAELFLAEDNLSKEKFKDVQRKFPQSLPDEIIKIYNENDQPVFINNTSYQWPRAVIDRVKKERMVSFSEGNRESVGIYYMDNSGNFIVFASAVDTYGFHLLRQLFLGMLTAFIVSVFILFFSGQIFARITLTPIKKVINGVKFIRSTSLNKRLETKKGKDEITELIATFNNLLEHLEQSFEAQRYFVTHASHELRTPITSIVGHIEVIISAEREKDEYKITLEEVLREVEKLNEIINNLFDLAQTNIGIAEFQVVRLDEILWQLKDEWAGKIPGIDIELIYNLPEDVRKFTITGNNYLLFIALSNILKNAIKFSANQVITCRLSVLDDAPVISIKDKGIGISKEDVQNIFKPFFRGANASGYPGLGIGLSLTDKIIKLHNAKVLVNSELNYGTEFLILFSR